jgi:RHH-type transcriptional regulator, rel operon repressor / antitoxin RelB
MATATVILCQELATGLDELAASRGRTRSESAEEAVARFLDYERWAIAHIQEGLRQAEAGEFVSDEEMDEIFGTCQDDASSTR